MYGKKLEQVKSFKYLRITLTDNAIGKNEIAIRISTATSIMVRLKMIWKSREISFKLNSIIP